MAKLDSAFLKKIIPKFNAVLETDQGQTWTLEREKKDLFFKKNFAEESIDKIDEGCLENSFTFSRLSVAGQSAARASYKNCGLKF